MAVEVACLFCATDGEKGRGSMHPSSAPTALSIGTTMPRVFPYSPIGTTFPCVLQFSKELAGRCHVERVVLLFAFVSVVCFCMLGRRNAYFFVYLPSTEGVEWYILREENQPRDPFVDNCRVHAAHLVVGSWREPRGAHLRVRTHLSTCLGFGFGAPWLALSVAAVVGITNQLCVRVYLSCRGCVALLGARRFFVHGRPHTAGGATPHPRFSIILPWSMCVPKTRVPFSLCPCANRSLEDGFWNA